MPPSTIIFSLGICFTSNDCKGGLKSPSSNESPSQQWKGFEMLKDARNFEFLILSFYNLLKSFGLLSYSPCLEPQRLAPLLKILKCIIHLEIL